MRISLILPLLTAVLLAAGHSAQAQSRVAVADPVRIFAELQETNDLKQRLEEENRQVIAQRRDREERIRALKAQVDLLRPDSDEYARRNAEFEQALIELEVWQQLWAANNQRRQKQQMRMIFDKIVAGVGEVARSRGIDVVIASQRPQLPDNLDGITIDQLRTLLNQQNVLFAAEPVDLTNDVVTLLNEKYKKGE